MPSSMHESSEFPVTHDPETNTYATRYDPEGERTASLGIVRAVAEATGVCPTGLDDSLGERVDTDALDNLFPHLDDAAEAGRGVWFEFADHRVVVYGDGEIEVSAASSAPRRSKPRRSRTDPAGGRDSDSPAERR